MKRMKLLSSIGLAAILCLSQTFVLFADDALTNVIPGEIVSADVTTDQSELDVELTISDLKYQYFMTVDMVPTIHGERYLDILRSYAKSSEVKPEAFFDLAITKRNALGNPMETLSESSNEIEVVIDIPDNLDTEAKDFYIIMKSGDFMTTYKDRDDDKDTITFRTDMYGTFALASAVKGTEIATID